MKISREDAFIYSLIKWEYLKKSGYGHNHYEDEDLPCYDILCLFSSLCGLCEYGQQHKGCGETMCTNCHLSTCDDFICCYEWDKWTESRSKKKRKTLALALYNRILAQYKKEFPEHFQEAK